MKSPESELEELRARVTLLEARLDALAPTLTVPGGNAPPPLQPSTSAVQPTAPAATSRRFRLPRPNFNPTHWIAGAGAVIFLLGALYGLTVSIQRGWISPATRVALGMITGAAFGVGAARQLRSNVSLGVALLAAGAGTWTFAFYYGSQTAQLFSSPVGLAGAVFAVLACGALAARDKSDGAMAVSLATGLIAPLVFAHDRGNLAGALLYLSGLAAAQAATAYVSRTGETWRFSRLLGTAGLWFVALTVCLEARRGVAPVNLVWLAGLAATTLFLVWLPRHPGRPWAPGAGTVLALIGFTLAAWAIWQRAGLTREHFAYVLAGLCVTSLALLRLARTRTGGNDYDRTLLLLATGCGLVAVPVACEWRWVLVVWSAAAVALAWLGQGRVRLGGVRAENLQLAALVTAAAASAAWLALALGQNATAVIFVNRVFLGAVATAAAWGLLLGAAGPIRVLAFTLLELVAVCAVAWEFSRAIPNVSGEEATLALGTLLATLTYAGAGAGQWLRGTTAPAGPTATALRIAGYGWFAVATGKLFLQDLAGRDLLLRAAAALGVGAVFIAVAIRAHQRRPRRPAETAPPGSAPT